MKYSWVLVLAMVACVGCGGGTSTEVNSDEAIVPETLAEHGKVLQEIRNSQKGNEFRGLAMGIPIGPDGQLRIVVPQNDEGDQVYSPSQITEAFVDEYHKLAKVACKKPGDEPVSPIQPRQKSPFEGPVKKPELRNEALPPAPTPDQPSA